MKTHKAEEIKEAEVQRMEALERVRNGLVRRASKRRLSR